MPIFRRARLPFSRRFLPPGAGALRIAAGSAAGVASVTGVGVTIISAVGSTAGSTSVSGVGHGVFAALGASAGLASVSGSSVAVTIATGLSEGVATVTGIYDALQITSTNIIQKPVDYVLAGQQNMRRGKMSKAALKHAFNE